MKLTSPWNTVYLFLEVGLLNIVFHWTLSNVIIVQSEIRSFFNENRIHAAHTPISITMVHSCKDRVVYVNKSSTPTLNCHEESYFWFIELISQKFWLIYAALVRTYLEYGVPACSSSHGCGYCCPIAGLLHGLLQKRIAAHVVGHVFLWVFYSLIWTSSMLVLAEKAHAYNSQFYCAGSVEIVFREQRSDRRSQIFELH